MSMYISGMDMMTLAEYDYFAVVIYADGTIRSIFGNVIDGATAVPVPPHGRLGDLDALEKILKEKQAKYKARDLLATHELSEAMRMGFDAAVGHVLMAPTIIPAEGGDK